MGYEEYVKKIYCFIKLCEREMRNRISLHKPYEDLKEERKNYTYLLKKAYLESQGKKFIREDYVYNEETKRLRGINYGL